MTKLFTGETVSCPVCRKAQTTDAAVENFTIPGRTGAASAQEHECEWCDAPFQVICLGDGHYQVAEVD